MVTSELISTIKMTSEFGGRACDIFEMTDLIRPNRRLRHLTYKFHMLSVISF